MYILSRICGGNEKEGVRMIQDIQQYIHDEFQWFHRHPELSHPELSFKEVETTERIRQDLQKGGLRILNLPLETGSMRPILIKVSILL